MGIRKRKQRSALNVKGHKSTKNEETGLMIQKLVVGKEQKINVF